MKCQCISSKREGGCDGDAVYAISGLCSDCEVRGCECAPRRWARVTSTKDVRSVELYLPSNFHIVKSEDGLFVSGFDDHGWTLEDYVIPRLASGLIDSEVIK